MANGHLGEPHQTLRFDFRQNPNLIGDIRLGLRNAMLDFAKLTEAKAKRNVKPGVGPGPHPHRTDHGWEWVDTGNLMRDVHYEMYKAGEKSIGFFVGAWTLNYGRFLEEGFHGPSGRFYRYPWPKPAHDAASREIQALLDANMKPREIVRRVTKPTGWGYDI